MVRCHFGPHTVRKCNTLQSCFCAFVSLPTQYNIHFTVFSQHQDPTMLIHQYSHVWEVDSDVRGNGCYEMAAEWVMQSGCDSKGLVNRTDTRLSSHNSSIPNRSGILMGSVVFRILSLTQTCCSRCLCDKKWHVLFLNRWQDLFEENQTDNKVSCTNEVWVLSKKRIK